MSTASLRVRRLVRYADKIRKYGVFIDGVEASKIQDGEELVFTVAPGRHTLEFKIDWCRSEPFEFTVAEGQEAIVECFGRPAWKGPYYAFIARGRYVGVQLAAPSCETHPAVVV